MRRWAIGAVKRATLPIDEASGLWIVDPFPPRLLCGCERDVRVYRIVTQGSHAIGIGFGAGARRHTEKPRFGINRP